MIQGLLVLSFQLPECGSVILMSLFKSGRGLGQLIT